MEPNESYEATVDDGEVVISHQESVQFPDEDLEPSYDDSVQDMTYARRVARFMSRFSWYNPQARARADYDYAVTSGASASAAAKGEEAANDETAIKPPSLDAAWTYFEHSTLPRHFLSAGVEETSGMERSKSFVNRKNSKDVCQKAERGECEQPTKLYSVWGTAETDLADFGIGVGIYFQTLRVLAFIMLIAGLINIPSIMFFSSDDYSANEQEGVKTILQGSAVCSDQIWVACPTCFKDQWDKFPSTYDRYAESADGTLRFIKQNRCSMNFRGGLLSWISLLFVFVAIYIMGWLSKRKEVKFDEAAQTASDYSVEVENPPTDARDPDKWRDFFSQFGHITVCTVALDNEELVRLLAKRRKLLTNLENLLPPGVKFDKFDLDRAVSEANPLSMLQKLMCCSDAESIRAKIAEMDEKILELSNQTYAVSNVFITFETEQAQRRALTALSVRRWDVWRNNTSAMPEELLFQDGYLLAVREPPEPSSVRWEDLDETIRVQLGQRVFTFILSLAVICGGGALIALCRHQSGAAVAAFMVAFLNTITPMVCRFICSYESHTSEGSMEASLYIKITALRWTNTAIVQTIITPFTDTLSNGKGFLIQSIYAIFIAEMIKTPVLQILDIMGNLKRHYFGPRALDQRRMNSLFQGTHYRLSERYTDMTKVIFFTFFYSALFPTGFFFASLTLVVHYWTDKFCLLRSWAPGPVIGTKVASFSRDYFFTLALLVFAVIASYVIASFPYDNACEDASFVSSNYYGDHVAKDGDGNLVDVSISPGDSNFFFCYQDLLRSSPVVFPALPSEQPEGEEWMTEGQEDISRIYGWTSVGVLVAVAVLFFERTIVKMVRNVFCKPYKPSGRAMDEKFSEVDEIFGYVPQVRQPGRAFPLLVCDISGIDQGLIGWRDPYHSYNHHNLIFDVPGLVTKRSEVSVAAFDTDTSDSRDEYEEKPVFSIVKNWNPPKRTNASDAGISA